jgi:hypothetical protein
MKTHLNKICNIYYKIELKIQEGKFIIRIIYIKINKRICKTYKKHNKINISKTYNKINKITSLIMMINMIYMSTTINLIKYSKIKMINLSFKKISQINNIMKF